MRNISKNLKELKDTYGWLSEKNLSNSFKNAIIDAMRAAVCAGLDGDDDITLPTNIHLQLNNDKRPLILCYDYEEMTIKDAVVCELKCEPKLVYGKDENGECYWYNTFDLMVGYVLTKDMADDKYDESQLVWAPLNLLNISEQLAIVDELLGR